jgi:hypothetical protein
MPRSDIESSFAVEGPTTREVFEANVGKVLAPELRPGQIVVMDNLSAQKGSRIRGLGETASCVTCHPTPGSQSHREGLLEV